MKEDEQEDVSMASRGQPDMAQRSDEEREEWTAEQEGELQGMREEEGKVVEEREGKPRLPSQRMHSKGEQGSQTRSLPVSR